MNKGFWFQLKNISIRYKKHLLGGSIWFCVAACSAQSNYDALVSKSCNDRNNCFASIQNGIDASQQSKLKGSKDQPFRILVEAGSYQEKVRIDYSFIVIEGENQKTTHLHNNLAASDAKKFHRDGWGTPGSATLTINASNVTVKNITVENTFDHPANDSLEKSDPKKVKHSQAVALLLDIDSDRVLLENISLVSYQDTLFANGKRAWVKKSKVSGNVDFIFGDGQVLIEDSEIISRIRGKAFKPGSTQGHVSAASTSIKNKYGFVFLNSRLTREENVPDHSHSLGRPWHPTTTFADGRYADPEAIGYVAYFNCYMDSHIKAEAWASMKGTARDGTKSRVFTPSESRFYEFNSSGPGSKRANNQGKVLQEADLEAIKKEVMQGWTI